MTIWIDYDSLRPCAMVNSHQDSHQAGGTPRRARAGGQAHALAAPDIERKKSGWSRQVGDDERSGQRLGYASVTTTWSYLTPAAVDWLLGRLGAERAALAGGHRGLHLARGPKDWPDRKPRALLSGARFDG